MAWAPTRPVPEPVGVIRTVLLRTRARVPLAVVRRWVWRAAMAVSSGRSVMPPIWTAVRTCWRAGTKAAPLCLCVELGDQGGVALDDAGDVALGVAGRLELVGELGGLVQLALFGGTVAAGAGGIRPLPRSGSGRCVRLSRRARSSASVVGAGHRAGEVARRR